MKSKLQLVSFLATAVGAVASVVATIFQEKQHQEEVNKAVDEALAKRGL